MSYRLGLLFLPCLSDLGLESKGLSPANNTKRKRSCTITVFKKGYRVHTVSDGCDSINKFGIIIKSDIQGCTNQRQETDLVKVMLDIKKRTYD